MVRATHRYSVPVIAMKKRKLHETTPFPIFVIGLGLVLWTSLAGGQTMRAHKTTKIPSAPQVSFESDLAAAQEGDVQAQLRVGKAFYQGTNGKRNFEEAVRWFDLSSKQNSTEASAWLGSCYLSGRGVVQDLTRAAALIQSSASANDPVGLRFLGIMYETGQGVGRDYVQAMANFSKAAKLNDPESFDHMGTMFLRGLGVKKNVAKAQRFFAKGARLGDSWSQLNLGELYANGNFVSLNTKSGKSAGLPQLSTPLPGIHSLVSGAISDSNPLSKPNLAKALKLFTRSAAQGNRVAAFKAGEMFQTGNGVPQDDAKALNFFRQSAAKQYAPAQLALGRATELGQGTPVNLTFAYLWYSLAAAQENSEARQRLDSLARKLTPAQLDEAQGLLSQLQSKMNGN